MTPKELIKYAIPTTPKLKKPGSNPNLSTSGFDLGASKGPAAPLSKGLQAKRPQTTAKIPLGTKRMTSLKIPTGPTTHKPIPGTPVGVQRPGIPGSQHIQRKPAAVQQVIGAEDAPQRGAQGYDSYRRDAHNSNTADYGYGDANGPSTSPGVPTMGQGSTTAQLQAKGRAYGDNLLMGSNGAQSSVAASRTKGMTQPQSAPGGVTPPVGATSAPPPAGAAGAQPSNPLAVFGQGLLRQGGEIVDAGRQGLQQGPATPFKDLIGAGQDMWNRWTGTPAQTEQPAAQTEQPAAQTEQPATFNEDISRATGEGGGKQEVAAEPKQPPAWADSRFHRQYQHWNDIKDGKVGDATSTGYQITSQSKGRAAASLNRLRRIEREGDQAAVDARGRVDAKLPITDSKRRYIDRLTRFDDGTDHDAFNSARDYESGKLIQGDLQNKIAANEKSKADKAQAATQAQAAAQSQGAAQLGLTSPRPGQSYTDANPGRHASDIVSHIKSQHQEATDAAYDKPRAGATASPAAATSGAASSSRSAAAPSAARTAASARSRAGSQLMDIYNKGTPEQQAFLKARHANGDSVEDILEEPYKQTPAQGVGQGLVAGISGQL